ncbi:MAG: type I-E CRISPR-associated protein Cse2/CasB [Candidatus Binatus sp.]|uniref:type I-E CRISPR-associated protein Cse2/CasB n=1 Tax=Candidatus Binatus sp. TaxID=2811406 RepID=UPI0027266886|nr:type I-E CRISPR-associated protein Cse2/CasB [Candidatus Binatus sp.]MDO8434694.1 type I-E CRISPR-associated protein Cse2/CasB [Candidatus Binatus sp.]
MEQAPAETSTLASLAGRLAALISDGLSPGDVATMRRMRPDEIGAPIFWRLAASELAGEFTTEGPRRDRQERRWAVILQAMAEMRHLHDPRKSLGASLADADIAEQRLLKLLRAGDDALFDAVRVIAHHLATRGVATNTADLARLILSDGGPNQESVRRKLARDFYGAQSRKETASAS